MYYIMSNSSNDNIYYETNVKINRIINKESLKEGEIIPVGNYEIVKGPYYNTHIFRKISNKKCYIEFNLNYEYKNNFMLHIDIFSCIGDKKGDGLKMLVELVRYISDKALENGLNNETSIIQLSAEPLISRGGLAKLVLYYIKIGFNTVDDDIKPLSRELAIKGLNFINNIDVEELNEDEGTKIMDFIDYLENNRIEKVLMEANIPNFLDLHRDLLVGGKSKQKRKTKNIKRRKIKRRKTKRI